MAESVRTLSEEEKEKLARDVSLVSEFKRNKYENEAQKNWDVFYKRNTTKFFKDRHWTRREFGELINSSDEESLVLFEVGCGVGNFMFPLMSEDENMYVYACDFSHRAVQFVKENPSYDPSRCTVFQCDIVNDDLTNQVTDGTVDVATMIFVLSAIHPDKMAAALRKIVQTLKPGGCLLVRDYGLYDYAMLRFAPGHKLSENFYVRQDGTRAYYFSLEILDTLMRSSGFEVSRSEYIHRQTVNKKEGLEVPRTFVQGKYVKPTGVSLQSTQSTENEAAIT